MFLYDLIDPDLLHRMRDEGYIRRQLHPSTRLAILNYTEKASFDRVWNQATRLCRGLIYDTESEQIIARPFPKFFNYGEEDVDHSYYSTHVIVTDKLDGSLGICYREPDGKLAIATRGSFMSDQAAHATRMLQDRYAGWEPPGGMTALFEIIYPQNRVVCDYQKMDDLVLLGAVSIEDGWSAGPFIDWPGPSTKVFSCSSFQQAIEMPPRPGAEGIVVHFPDLDKRLKIKQADYVMLHRLVTGLNERRVWEAMKDGHTFAEIAAPFPEEFLPWLTEVHAGLSDRWYDCFFAVEEAYKVIINSLPGGFERKDFALLATRTAIPEMLFLKLDNRDFGERIWDQIKPAYGRGPWQQTEDTA